MFACSAYPAYDEEYMSNVEKEAEDNVKRIRHHACLALLCGNNEIEQVENCITENIEEGGMTWDEYKSLFDILIPGVIKKHAPYVSYWPSSPHTPGNRKDYDNPCSGDAHLWGVWHGRKPFEWYRECEHRLNSEFGFQSFPSPETVREYNHLVLSLSA
jgi:beta-mannosidase